MRNRWIRDGEYGRQVDDTFSYDYSIHGGKPSSEWGPVLRLPNMAADVREGTEIPHTEKPLFHVDVAEEEISYLLWRRILHFLQCVATLGGV